MTVTIPHADLVQALELLERAGLLSSDARSSLAAALTIAPDMTYPAWLRSIKGRSPQSLAEEYGADAVRTVLVLAAAGESTPTPAFELYGLPVLAVRTIHEGRTVGQDACMLPGPKVGEHCSLPVGHDPANVHEVQVLAYATIARFTSDTENPMTPTSKPSDDAKRDAGRKRAERSDIAAKPVRPRSTPTPRDVRPQGKPEQR